jgi:hypothetical protein
MRRTDLSTGVRTATLSVVAGAFAPVVFVMVVVLRKVNRRANLKYRFYSKRMRAEIARWS